MPDVNIQISILDKDRFIRIEFKKEVPKPRASVPQFVILLFHHLVRFFNLV